MNQPIIIVAPCNHVMSSNKVIKRIQKTDVLLHHSYTRKLFTFGVAMIGMLTAFSMGPAYAAFPAVIDVVTDTAEISDDYHVTIDGEWVASRPMGDLDGDGLGDRIIEIPPIPGDQCPGVAVLQSTLNAGLSFSRESLGSLVRITAEATVGDNDRVSCGYRNLRFYTQPRRLGDINGDGLIDFVIFSNLPRIVFGSTTPGTVINLDELDGSNGFSVAGSGPVIFPVGDINGDGYDDIGYNDANSEARGVVAGRASLGAVLDIASVTSDQRLIGPIELSRLSGLGDIDGDGFDDLIALPHGREPFVENQIPRFVYGASNLALRSLEDNDSRVDRMLTECGTRQCEISPVGDIDGDGLDDLLASQRFGASNLPPRSILYGRTGGLVVRDAIADYPDGERTILLGQGGQPLKDTGEFYRSSYLVTTGRRFDLDADGVDDLLFRQRVDGGVRQGWYALFGIQGKRPAVRSLEEADGLLGVAFDLGTALSPQTSSQPPHIGDLDLDGIDDFTRIWHQKVPHVSGRSREIENIDPLGLGVRRSLNDLNLFWSPVQGAASYRIQIDDRFTDEVGSDTTRLTVPDNTDGAALIARVEALDNAGSVLSTQLRRVPVHIPIIDSFSVTVYGPNLLEMFIKRLPEDYKRFIRDRFLVLRDGRIIGRMQGTSFADASVQPGQRYQYQLVRDVFTGIALDDIELELGPRLQRATQSFEAVTPGGPVVPPVDDPDVPPVDDPDVPPVDDPNDNGPEAAENLRVTRYSPADAELFWDRADEPLLQYEVYRDGELISTQFGISYYDSRRPLNTGSSYEVVAFRSDGSRSDARSVTLEPVGDDSGDDSNDDPSENGPEAPANLRVVRYSPKDAELFWDRADEPLLQYEVYRDGELVSTQFGISYYDSRRPFNTGSSYEIVTLRSDGSRSDARSVTLAPVGDDSGDDSNDDPSENGPEAPANLRVVRYSPKDAELFWDRASEPALQYEVYRDGELLGSGFAISYFDTNLNLDAAASYEVIAFRSDGSRSSSSLVTLGGK